MRKHGHEAFTVVALSSHNTLAAAQAEEIAAIARCRPIAYNVSEGGEHDAGTGGKIFWERIKADPEAYAAYIARLSAAVRASPNCVGGAEHLNALFAAKSPRDRWKFQQRATRMARNKAGFSGAPVTYGPGPDTTNSPAKEKRHSITSRRNAKALWARRTEEEKRALGEKIAGTLREVYAEGSAPRARLAEVARKGRETMDRVKQGAAASKGLKQFWADLKTDPEAYAAHIARRRETLLKTLEAKGLRCKRTTS